MTKDRYHDWYKLYDKLSVEINPDPEELKQLFNQESPIDPINLRGLELKFEAATREQTVIEKTLFFRHTYNILSIYKKNAPVVMTYHHAEITTENIHLDGNQQFLLNWLLERLRIIMASDGERQREHVVKFFDVWSEIYGLFWW